MPTFFCIFVRIGACAQRRHPQTLLTFSMNRTVIHQNESLNLGGHIHCHYHPDNGTWVAYGKSAYALQQMVDEAGLCTINRYSTELDMACIMVGDKVLESVSADNCIERDSANGYLCITSTAPFDEATYNDWVAKVKASSHKKEHRWVAPIFDKAKQTAVPPSPKIRDGMSSVARIIRRTADIVSSSLAIVIFTPLYLVIYLFIKMEDGGQAIFKQERIGRHGRPFYIYKFRSMRVDAEKNGPQLSHSCGEYDSRITKVGRFIRAHHLDELPQLWNVFLGDMSFVGPRPERKFYIDQIMEYDKRYEQLYQIRPGVTSYATLYNGYTDNMEKMLRRLEYDLYYLEHRSLYFDTKILFYTFCAILFGKKF